MYLYLNAYRHPFQKVRAQLKRHFAQESRYLRLFEKRYEVVPVQNCIVPTPYRSPILHWHRIAFRKSDTRWCKHICTSVENPDRTLSWYNCIAFCEKRYEGRTREKRYEGGTRRYSTIVLCNCTIQLYCTSVDACVLFRRESNLCSISA